MLKSLTLLLILAIFVGCQAKGGGAPGGGIISGHVPVDNKFTLSTPINVTYIAGQTIPFTLTFPLDVTVTGTPKLTVTIGSSTVDADFVSVTGNALLFEYDVQAGDSDLNGIAVASTMNFNGATLTFNGGENCNATISVPSLSSVKVSAVSGAAPVANNITPANFNEDTSSTITLNYIDGDGDQATSCAIVSPVKVSVTTPCACAAGVCTVGVTGSPNQNGAAGFGYTVTSLGQTSNTASATFTLNPVADAPVATNVSHGSVNEDTITTVTLAYTDADGDLATVCATSALNNVSVTTPCACAAGTCTVSVRGATNYSGAAGFSFTVTANGQLSNTALVGMTITAVNDAPVNTTTTAAAFNEDTQSIITLSYTDAESDPATACSVTGESNVTESTLCSCSAGVCTVGITGTLNYNGAGGAFTYTVTAGGQSSSATPVTFTINPVDDKPVATTTTAPAFNENTQSIITLAYTDVESHAATACALSNLSNVSITQACTCVAGTCTVGVTGDLNYTGAAGFDYTVTANALVSDPQSVALTINDVDAAPVATNITPGPFAEDSVNTITLAYTDADGDQATTCSVTGETNVTESTVCSCAAGVCTVGITGAPHYNGAGATFSYTVTANGLPSNSATATITYTAVDDKPVGTTTTAADFNKNAQSIITLTYTDVESDSATTCSIASLVNVTETQPCACAAGVCTVGVTGTLNYTGPASFDYKVTANGLDSDDETVTFNILSVDNAPVATNVTPGPFAEDSVNTITLAYTDSDGDLATTCSVSGEANVTVSTACSCAAGVCTVGITGAADYNGAGGTFNYTVTANGVPSNSATATFTYTAVDDKPVGTTTTAPNFNENTQSVINLLYSDVESDSATTCTVSALNNVTETQACACVAGSCSVGVTGTLNYDGAAGLTYTVTANGLTSDPQAVTFTIDNVDAAPVATNITPGPFAEDSVNSIQLAYTDADSDQATTCSVTSPSNITVSTACSCVAGVCSVGITGAADYFGNGGTFSYTVTANGLTSNTATATITYSAVDDRPVATTTTAPNFNENTQSIITLLYTDVESDSATTCTVSSLDNVTETQPCACVAGSCTVGVTGTLNYYGAAGLTYTVTANGLTSDPQAVTFTIENVSYPPVATDITPGPFAEDSVNSIQLAYTDADSDLATTCSVTSPANVTVSTACSCAAGVCTVGITGDTDYNGTAAGFSYTVTAAGQTSNTATASITYTAVDDKPVTNPIVHPNFNEDTITTITLGYTDIEGNSATSCSITNLNPNITVTTACACTLGACSVSVRGATDYYGSAIAAFDYSVTANGLASDPDPVTLNIDPVMDAPTTANLSTTTFNEDTQSVITLTYTPVGGDLATSCSVTSPLSVTVTQACACTSGTCTVGVTGSPQHFNGSGSFQWTVSAGTAQSASRNAPLTITPVDDDASLGAISSQSTNMNTPIAVPFTFNDPDGAVCTSARLSMTSSDTTVVANTSVVWSGTAPNCTATITPATNKVATGLTITITATDGALANKTTAFSLDVNGVLLEWLDDVNAVITSYDFGNPNGNVTVNLSVRNTGNVTSGTVNITDSNSGNRINLLTASCTGITPNGTCTVQIRFQNNGGGATNLGLNTDTTTAAHTGSPSAAITVQGIKD